MKVDRADMQQVIGLIIILAIGIVAIKVAIALLVLAGLIFRTKETIGLLAICGIFAGFSAHPGIGFGILGLVAIIALYRAVTKPGSIPEELSKPED